MRLDAATFLLQWSVGGLAFLWFTLRSKEISLGYSKLLRATYGVLAVLGVATGFYFDRVLIREVAGVAVAGIAFATFARRESRTDLFAVAIGAVGLIGSVVANSGGVVDLLRVLVGAAFLGAITDLMLLGHWYLVQPGMTRKLLNELTNAVLFIWPLEVVVMILPTGMISVLNGSIDDGWNGILGYFWLGCAVLTGVLAFFTRAALKERSYSAVMAATGLSYLAILTAFGTDLVARATLAL
ncbi:MAG: hypothetical protein NWR84_00845 [Ilumatobacteraceae bacterium]|nr:hypothetical protein [Ilumatobacteraceae bacterium]MDP4735272.1 hypothetical protein [Ilumatobacteraceae bacterium]